MDTKHFANGITVGPALDKSGLERLRSEGVKRVIDLRTEGETDPISPEEEQNILHEQGTEHVNIPVDWKQMDFDQADRILLAIEEAEGPVYVHSGQGKRAAVMVIAERSIKKRSNPKEAVREAEALGAFQGGSRAEDFLSAYVAQHVGVDLVE